MTSESSPEHYPVVEDSDNVQQQATSRSHLVQSETGFEIELNQMKEPQ